MIRLYPIDPISAPRQVQSDRWRSRPAVARYRAYRDELHIKGLQIPEPFHHFVFVLAMAPSWSEAKKQANDGMPHHLKPDRDNLEKAVLDAYFGEDRHIWHGAATKIWGRRGVLLVSDRFVPFHSVGQVNLLHVYEACSRWRVGEQAHNAQSLGLPVATDDMREPV
jgi:Holliday junction resolvase RusA-like endonuclease